MSLKDFTMSTASPGSSYNRSSNPYAGTQYEDLWNSNPYAQNSRKDSIFDKIGNLFGIRTGADKWQDELDMRAREFDSQLASIVREEDYNSESSKVTRMREAGFNPDLMGIDSASSASEFAEPETSPESSTDAGALQAAGGVLSFGTGFTKSLLDIGNTLLTLEHNSLINEGLANDNASNVLDLVSNAGNYYDMPDLDIDTSDLTPEEAEGVLLDSSKKVSGRIETIANMLFGSPRSRSVARAKANFIKSMHGRSGTLSELNERLSKEVSAAVSKGDLNVARSQLKGRKSVSNSELIEGAVLESTLLDAWYQAELSSINARWISDEGNQDLISEGLTNEAVQAAEIDPHQAAKAANTGFSADIADANASIAESKVRSKEAEIAALDAEYRAQQWEIVKKTYDEWKVKHPRRFRRQMLKRFGYTPVNEPSFGAFGNGGATTGFNYSNRRSSSSVVRKLVK